jgi:hypothetical protein
MFASWWLVFCTPRLQICERGAGKALLTGARDRFPLAPTLQLRYSSDGHTPI